MNRREFLAVLSAATLAAASGRVSFGQESGKALDVLIFWQDGFPAIDGMPLTRDFLVSSLTGHALRFAGIEEIGPALEKGADVFVNPYGSAFPQSAWKPILGYLLAGGNLVNLGGRPFSVPVGPDLKPGTRQTNYHKRLGITQYFAIDGAAHDYFISRAHGVESNIRPSRVFASYHKLTNVNDYPNESGSDGRREAQVSAFLLGYKRELPEAAKQFPDGYPVSAPIIDIHRLRGDFAGGRWVLANYAGEIDAPTVSALVGFAALGGFEVKARPVLAHALVGEKQEIRIEFTNPRGVLGVVTAEIGITDARSKSVWSGSAEVTAGKSVAVPVRELPPGFYEGNLYYEIRSKSGISNKLAEPFAFWVTDGKPIVNGPKFSMDRYFLFRDNEPYPVAGTTFMSGDVARRFLFEPNVADWNYEFSRMRNAGVNMIRTGIWTGWEKAFDGRGEVREEVLRAWEAFILTAAKHDIPVMFTFFAFMPLMFGGENAYLDPRSIAGQKKFLAAFASRVRGARGVLWDLINEPSFANPKMLWSCRPNYDRFEAAAWKEWLGRRFEERDESRLAAIVRDRWRLREDEDAFAIPPLRDFEIVNILVDRRPLRTVDFRLFAQDVFTEWARSMRETLHAAGSPEQLVTVGQDEGGTGDSPSTQFHADAMELTGLHNWWLNDDLLWDSVVTKTPGKPNLVQETGLMFYERQEGSAWRDDATAADLLERKMALSLGAGGAGFIQWIWNINPFMDNENESAIGFARPDGSFKEEFRRFRAFAKFANTHRRLFRGRIDEDVVVVIPHSQMFSPRNLATEATKRSVRMLEYGLGVACRAVSEYGLGAILAEKRAPSALILPAPRTFSDRAWSQILKLIERGSHLAVTGFFEEDEHFRPADRVGRMFGFSGARPVAQFEGAARFSGEKIQRIERADTANDETREFVHGAGRIVWNPVPLENSDIGGPLEAFYRKALGSLAEKSDYVIGKPEGVLVRANEFEGGRVLFTIVNETGSGRRLDFRSPASFRVDVGAGRANLIFVDKRSGAVLARVFD